MAGKTIAIVHAAWHSCGSYQLNVSQASAYRRLGARVISLALREWPPGSLSLSAKRWRDYIAKTSDMPADERYYSNMPLKTIMRPKFLKQVYWPLIHGDHARATAGFMDLAPIPAGLEGREIDLVHCNHFFCMPAAYNLLAACRHKKTAPVIVETQDIQADQYVLRNGGLRLLPPAATYETMLATELDWLARADVLVNLNARENTALEKLLPQARNALVYPAIPAVPTGPGGGDIIIVASANYANYLSVVWFLEAILPLAGPVDVKIIGNVDQEIAHRNPALYEAHRRLFLGRIDNVSAAYAGAGLILLPTSEGHGLSIKTVEAMSSGAPLIATPQAFRGMQAEAEGLGMLFGNLTLCGDAETFAAALRAAADFGPQNNPAAHGDLRSNSDTRRYYDAHFSDAAYASALLALAQSLAVV